MDERLQYKAYLHSDKDSNWSKAEELGIDELDLVMDKFMYSLYEVKFDMELDIDTGKTWIMAVNGMELKEPVKG